VTTAFVLGWKVLASLPLCHSERAVDTIVFSVNNKSGTPWASASDALKLNADGFDAAAHVSVQVKGVVVKTGFAGEARGAPDPR
jgi:hypothetical protein